MSRNLDHFVEGGPYERYVGRWSRLVAPRFVAWLDLPEGLRWLDVGCGTGALCASILEVADPAQLTGVEPSDGFLEVARQRLGDRATLLHGSADPLPVAAASVDVTVSGLVLNFVPDRVAALREMGRVTAPGGTVAAYVWDYASGMQMMRHFWDAVVALDQRGREIDETVRFPWCLPQPLASLFADAGLRDVTTSGIEIATTFRDFDDYWSPFMGGQGPAPSYAMALNEASRQRLRDRIRERLPVASDGSIPLTARAWAVRGTVGR